MWDKDLSQLDESVLSGGSWRQKKHKDSKFFEPQTGTDETRDFLNFRAYLYSSVACSACRRRPRDSFKFLDLGRERSILRALCWADLRSILIAAIAVLHKETANRRDTRLLSFHN